MGNGWRSVHASWDPDEGKLERGVYDHKDSITHNSQGMEDYKMSKS